MDTDDFETEDSHLVKDLRKQLAEAHKRAKLAEEELSQAKSQNRERSVADVLTAKGVNPKVAKFIPADVDGEEAISQWLEENGELFGGAPQVDEPAVSDETKAQLSKANALQERSVSPDKVADLEQQMANAGSLEEINGILSEFQKFQL